MGSSGGLPCAVVRILTQNHHAHLLKVARRVRGKLAIARRQHFRVGGRALVLMPDGPGWRPLRISVRALRSVDNIIEGADDPKEVKWAETIRPLRKRGNLLLCTLLLGNTLVNAYLAILLDAISTTMWTPVERSGARRPASSTAVSWLATSRLTLAAASHVATEEAEGRGGLARAPC